MLDALQAQTDKLSRHVQTLFQPPALAWLEGIQQEIANPAVMLEQLLIEILGQYQGNIAGYSRATERPANAHRAMPAASQARLTQALLRVPRANFEEPIAIENVFSHRQRAQSSTSAQGRILPTNSVLGNTPETGDARASTRDSTSFTNTRSSQSTRLLTEIGDLQNLVQAVAEEQAAHASPPAAAHHPPTRKATEATRTEHANWSDDLSFIGALPNATHNETTKDLRWHETSPGLLSPGNEQNAQRRMEGDEDRDVLSPSEPSASMAISRNAEKPVVKTTTLSSRTPKVLPASIAQPDPLAPSTQASRSVQTQPAHNEAATRAQTLSALTTLDSAAQDLLLDQLLDRLEERQRENALRTLGFTGGQI